MYSAWTAISADRAVSVSEGEGEGFRRSSWAHAPHISPEHKDKLLVCDETSFSQSQRAASHSRRSSRRHRHGTGCAALPHPSTKLPPRKTARSDALSIEMGAPEARPPTAPESWLRVGSAPPLGIKASTTSHPTSQAGSEGDSTPDTARAQPPYPSDRTGPPRSSPHTISHRQIAPESGRQQTRRGERRERERRERRG